MSTESTILIVEDNESFRMLLADGFEEAGYNVLTAATGQEGAEKAPQEEPDFVLLDYTLPEKNGNQVLKEIRSHDSEWAQNVPVLMLTQHDDVGKVADTLSKGAQGYLTKGDVEIEDVVEEVESRLSL